MARLLSDAEDRMARVEVGERQGAAMIGNEFVVEVDAFLVDLASRFLLGWQHSGFDEQIHDRCTGLDSIACD